MDPTGMTPPPQPTPQAMTPPPGTAPAAPSQTPPAPEPIPAPPPPAPVGVLLPAEELQRLYAAQRELEDTRAAAAAQSRAAQEAQLLAEAQRGEVERSFTTFRQQAEQREQQLRATLSESALQIAVSQAITGVAWANATAAQHAAIILRQRVETVLDSEGRPTVRDRATGRPAVDALRELVAGPDFAMYRAAPHQGGTAAPTTFQAAPPQVTAAPTPAANLGEYMLQQVASQHPQGIPQIKKDFPFQL
jgi:hypothetical protein